MSAQGPAGDAGTAATSDLGAIARKLGIPVAKRHIFLCAEASNPKCCDHERSAAAWNFLKARLKELGLSEAGGIQRTRANCLRICSGGPIAVVYPEGAWYRGCDAPVLEQVIQQHLIGGKVVEEHLVLQHPLGADALDMKGDWNRRAKENASWYIATSEASGEDSFRASGLRDVRAFFDGIERLLHTGQVAVDIGCGTGRMDEFVAPQVGQLYGIDVSGEMLERAAVRLGHLPNVELREGDGWTLPLPADAATLVFSHIVLQHTPRRVTRSYFRDVLRVLRPGGDFVFQMPEAVPGAPPDPPEDDTFEMRFWREEDVRADLLGLGYEWIECRRFPVQSPLLDFNQLRIHVRRPGS